MNYSCKLSIAIHNIRVNVFIPTDVSDYMFII